MIEEIPVLDEMPADTSRPVESYAKPRRPRSPVTWRELVAVLLMVVLGDVTIYRGEGFAGIATLLIGSLLLFVLGTSPPIWQRSVWVIAGMLIVLAARLLWLGSDLGMACGAGLLVAFTVALRGECPHVFRVIGRTIETIVAGFDGLVDYGVGAARLKPLSVRVPWLATLLPLVAVALFGAFFVLANPNLIAWVQQLHADCLRVLEQWMREFPISVREVLFWLAIAWFVVGLLRPFRTFQTREDNLGSEPDRSSEPAVSSSALYSPFRNTLVSLIVLFAVYLVFEFRTLWFQEFPRNFAYSRYTHQGAGWLTTALAFATLTLSIIFSGDILRDSRLPGLRKLGWIWSAENLLLALSVYNRLTVYIDFNGMTRLRLVGLFGTSTVIAGFVLVVWKIARDRSFAWLIRNQLWALAIAIYLFAITPVDTVVHAYNVRQVLAGDLASVVPISAHAINSEGMLVLEPLLDCQDEIIRDGVRALCAERAAELQRRCDQQAQLGWTSYQIADHQCLARLLACQAKWQEFVDSGKQAAALERFHTYASQWY